MVARRLRKRNCWRGHGLRQYVLDVKPNYPDGSFQEQFCSKCNARCCRVGVWVPLLENEFSRINLLARKLELPILLSIQRIEGEDVWVMSYSDKPCGFLDQTTNRCLIYDDRPDYCKNFFCNGSMK